MKGFVTAIAISAALCMLAGCSQKPKQSEPVSGEQLKEDLVKANKAAVAEEDMQIESLVLRNGWKMMKTGTGLRYMALEKGNGKPAATGKTVTIGYEVRLINNEVVYTSEKSGNKQFVAGSGGVESGLEEGILLMRKGDKYRFIIPSYLAHGLAGDQDKIPQKATLIYTVKLIDIN